jgi:hypothetical protein
LHIEKDAAWSTFVRQPIQQWLSRWIDRHLIAGLLKPAPNRATERIVIVNDVNETRQFLLLRSQRQ